MSTIFLFLSTPSARRATLAVVLLEQLGQISIHALREEGDVRGVGSRFSTSIFLSTPSARRATHKINPALFREIFLSTPSARRATHITRLAETFEEISIHALREEGDPRSIMRLQVRYNFYPRPPRGGRRLYIPSGALPLNDFYPRPPRGGRQEAVPWYVTADLFLSTPSARRATPGSSPPTGRGSDFYPRPPRGGRRSSGR